MQELITSLPVTGVWCDATATVHGWRYLEVVNRLIEDWFERVGHSFTDMHVSADTGTPTTRLTLDVATPARLGETLELRLRLLRLGRSSLGFRVTGTCDGEPRLDAEATLVWVHNDRGRLVSCPIPEPLRGRMRTWLDGSGDKESAQPGAEA